jgi:2-keto-4-pentenoate hydratase/2-oxohepta-3-ene-1,7-dioic acid hydratase in catechol pathway
MKLVQFQTDDYYEAAGFLEGDRVLDLTRAAKLVLAMLPSGEEVPPWAFDSLQDMIDYGLCDPAICADIRAFIADHDLEPELEIANPILQPPLGIPSRIIALGLNYAAHAEESGRKPPKDPIFFVKASTSVIGPEEPVIIPKGLGRVDHEVELAVVLGEGGRNITRKKAMNCVAGYTILNDVTARDWQRRDMAASQPWFMSKSLDTFGPMGPCLVLPDAIGEPVHLDLTMRVNGEVRQHSNTRDMIFDIPELIHRLNRYIMLEPGDVITTGTPSGIAPIQSGDVMEAEIQGIGVLRNPVEAGK